MDETNFSTSTNRSSRIPCECEVTNQQPVDYLGDAVCSKPISSVREMVKRYEPDTEIRQNSSISCPLYNNDSIGKSDSGNISNSSSCCRNNSSSTNSNDLYRIRETNRFHKAAAMPSTSFSSKKYTPPLSNHVIYEEQRTQSTVPFQHQRLCSGKDNQGNKINSNQNSDRQNDVLNDLNDAAYKSKTTISKINQGIRITTDIYFDLKSKFPENWVVKRIETSIPQSKIINEFQKAGTSSF